MLSVEEIAPGDIYLGRYGPARYIVQVRREPDGMTVVYEREEVQCKCLARSLATWAVAVVKPDDSVVGLLCPQSWRSQRVLTNIRAKAGKKSRRWQARDVKNDRRGE